MYTNRTVSRRLSPSRAVARAATLAHVEYRAALEWVDSLDAVTLLPTRGTRTASRRMGAWLDGFDTAPARRTGAR